MRIVSRLLCIVGFSALAHTALAQEPVSAEASKLVLPTAPLTTEAQCSQPVYLTFDTGHMGIAPLVAEVLARQKVLATFFLANEATLTGGTSLDDVWAPWWKSMAQSGHAFATHTYDHVYWLSDSTNGRFKLRPTSGAEAKRTREWTSQEYCADLARAGDRFETMTGRKMLPLFRAPGGKTSPSLLQTAASCGYAHAGWAPAGFLGDELSSEQYPNAALLERSLRNIRAGDILMAHLGIWSRKDPWAPAVLEPLIEGLKKKGFCFATLETHPGYRGWIQARMTTVEPKPSDQTNEKVVELLPNQDVPVQNMPTQDIPTQDTPTQNVPIQKDAQ